MSTTTQTPTPAPMPKDAELAGWRYEGRFCSACEQEIVATDMVVANVDADYDGDGGYHDLTTVKHVVCPPDEQ